MTANERFNEILVRGFMGKPLTEKELKDFELTEDLSNEVLQEMARDYVSDLQTEKAEEASRKKFGYYNY